MPRAGPGGTLSEAGPPGSLLGVAVRGPRGGVGGVPSRGPSALTSGTLFQFGRSPAAPASQQGANQLYNVSFPAVRPRPAPQGPRRRLARCPGVPGNPGPNPPRAPGPAWGVLASEPPTPQHPAGAQGRQWVFRAAGKRFHSPGATGLGWNLAAHARTHAHTRARTRSLRCRCPDGPVPAPAGSCPFP